MSHPKKDPETRSKELAESGITKPPAMIHAEDLQEELANYKRSLRQRIIQIWNALNPNKTMADHYEWPTDDGKLDEELRTLVLEMERTFRSDIHKADQLLTARNNEILALNQRLDRLGQESANKISDQTHQSADQRIRISGLEDQVKVLEKSNAEAHGETRTLRGAFNRYRSETSSTIDSLRATVRVLSKELAVEMDARAVAEERYNHEHQRNSNPSSAEERWKKAIDGLDEGLMQKDLGRL